ncbi:Gfo/Idh/MocA family oxidoreductase [Nonomuraea sp. NPDC049152]|uniref:Gfo/Idh/MocA family oxidoreductase n=1 Tax=Nonomuraea sp. NPDC049152 TaxID=3154350 RepID=UPI0033E84EC3
MRYALVGLGHRAQMYVDALLGDWRDAGTVAAFCDTNRTRMDYYVERVGAPVPCFAPGDLGAMLKLCDAVVVATVDATHARYVVAALEAGPLDGIRSVMVGASANESIRTGRPVHLTDGGTRMASAGL